LKEKREELEGLIEGKLSFLPSYKFKLNVRGAYDYQEGKRIPSHTDRVLY